MTHPKSPLKIGIQGVKASFHDAAADEFFAGREFETSEFSSFRGLCEALNKNQLDYAVMAIENSIAGSILPNYQLLEKFKFSIIGETYLRIIMNLMALPGQKISDLQYVQSHPMALFQCEDFLAQFPHLKVLEAADTAESAQFIKHNHLSNYGAIASKKAAQIFGLDILAESIETNKQNYTRFLIVSRSPQENPKSNKSSLRFEISHHPGSLQSLLSIFTENKINMTKIQSIPILGRPYEYSFHVDIEWENSADYKKAMTKLRSESINLIQLGEYPKSQRPVV